MKTLKYIVVLLPLLAAVLPTRAGNDPVADDACRNAMLQISEAYEREYNSADGYQVTMTTRTLKMAIRMLRCSPSCGAKATAL